MLGIHCDLKNNQLSTKQNCDGFTNVGSTIGPLMKEIRRRVEHRLRLEVEKGVPLNDETFLEIAEHTGEMRL